jgi:hypothetical protein
MKVPKEFRNLAISFFPHSEEEVGDPTLEAWVDWVVQNFCTRDERRIVKAFLDELLDGTHDDAELQLAWDMTSPSYQFAGEGAMRAWLTLIRSRL